MGITIEAFENPVRVVCTFWNWGRGYVSADTLLAHRMDCELSEDMDQVAAAIQSLINQGKKPRGLVYWLPEKPVGKMGWNLSVAISALYKFDVAPNVPSEEQVRQYVQKSIVNRHELQGYDVLYAEFFPIRN